MAPDLTQYPAHQSSRPYTRWWWLGGPFRRDDIAYQLNWLQANGFGGVELAWLDPTWQGRPEAETRPEWLGAGRARLRLHIRELLAIRRVQGAGRGRSADADRSIHPTPLRIVGARPSAGPGSSLPGGAAALR